MHGGYFWNHWKCSDLGCAATYITEQCIQSGKLNDKKQSSACKCYWMVVMANKSYSILFSKLIVALAAVDSIFAGICLVEYSLKKGFRPITWTTPVYISMWPQFIYPLQNTAYSMSIFVTLAIAIERYVYQSLFLNGI